MPSDTNSLAKRVEELRAELKQANSKQIAAQAGARYQADDDETAHLHLTVWGKDAHVSDQDYIVRDAETNTPFDFVTQAALAYYLHDPKGSPPEEGYISFSELPNGQFYNSAFQGYTAKELLVYFGSEYQKFQEATQKAGGVSVPFASTAYKFQVFPKVSLVVACWEGDEEFPPSYRILFNSTVVYHLPTDVCAILAGALTSRLMKA